MMKKSLRHPSYGKMGTFVRSKKSVESALHCFGRVVVLDMMSTKDVRVYKDYC